MARWRFLSVALLALALTGNSTPSGRTQVPSATSSRCSERPMLSDKLDKNDRTCVIYSLSERGMDADLGKWIAETIPETIEPGSWKGAGVLRYYAPKNILVVNHSSTVHAKIDHFLQEVKTSLPKGNKSGFATSKKMPNDDVIPASYRQIAGPPEPSAYPVPAPAKAPKHLFHFLIRYEGEGIIDDNVVKFMKVQNQGEKEKTSVAGTGSAPDLPTLPCIPSAPVVGGSAGLPVVPSSSTAGGNTASSTAPSGAAPAAPSGAAPAAPNGAAPAAPNGAAPAAPKEVGPPEPTTATSKSIAPTVVAPAPNETGPSVPSRTVPYKAVR